MTLVADLNNGGLVGSGDDSKSFSISGSYPSYTITATPAGGTVQPGQYHVCAVARGNYTNSGMSACGVIVSAGPGGAGWQLAFSDEFAIPKGPSGTYMLNWQNQQRPVSITWGTGAGICAAGCGKVVLGSPSGWSPNWRAGNTISITGATNTGSGNINVNFQVYSVTDDQHFLIYMPGNASQWGTINVSDAMLGTGPWVASIVFSCNAPCANPTMSYANNASEGFAPENDTVGPGGLRIVTQKTPYTSADGVAHTYKSGHVQTWNGNAGFAEPMGGGIAQDFDGQVTTLGGANSGVWNAWWTLGSDNSWPGTGSGGGEVDVAEFQGTCNLTAYDVNIFDANHVAGFGGNSPSSTFIGTNHQFTSIQTSVPGVVSFYLDNPGGAPFLTTPSFASTDPRYPVIDDEFSANGCSGNAASLPLIQQTAYVRFYARVASGACYLSIPTATSKVVPHVGACNATAGK
jgi:hypothetical protein